MSLAFGRDHLAIPGPSVIPDRVLRAMHRSAPNIYAGPLVDLTAGLLTDLKQIARCEGTRCFLYRQWACGLGGKSVQHAEPRGPNPGTDHRSFFTGLGANGKKSWHRGGDH